MMSRANWTSLICFASALSQQYPAFQELSPAVLDESGKTAMQPTLSHFAFQPDEPSCELPVPPSGWKSRMTGTGELPV